MGNAPRLTSQTIRVLRAFLEAPTKKHTGMGLMRDTDLASGTIYPLLVRLEAHGLLSSEWEVQADEDLGRPRRRYYKLTGEGQTSAVRAIAEATQLSVSAELLPSKA